MHIHCHGCRVSNWLLTFVAEYFLGCPRSRMLNSISGFYPWNDGSTCPKLWQPKMSLKVKVLVARSCPTLSDPMDYSPSGSSVHGILQARILEWVAVLFSRGSSQPRYRTQVSRIAVGFFTVWVTGKLKNVPAAKLLQSCPTLCDPIDGSPPGSPVPGILQARTLEWVAISFSSAWKWKVKVTSLSCVWLFATPWTEAHQAPPSMGFSRQEYWSGVPLPSPKNVPKHGQMFPQG